MSEQVPVTNSPPATPETQGRLPGDGEQGRMAAHDTLTGHALESMTGLTPGQIAAKMSPLNAQTFGRERGAATTSAHLPADFHIAMADENGRAGGEAKESANEYSPLEPTGDRFLHKESYTPESGGKPLQIYTWEHIEPMTSQTYNPKTGVIQENYNRPFGIRGSGNAKNEYGGIWLDKQTSRTLAKREETKTPDGKIKREIEYTHLDGTYGYGALGVFTGHKKLDSCKMWQTEGVGKDGKPQIESWQDGVVWEKGFRGPYVKETREPAQKMANGEFDRMWKESHPKALEWIASQSSNNGDKNAQTTRVVPMRKG
jgi:hypothetical protein